MPRVFERLRLELGLGSAGPLTSSLLIKQIPPRWRHEEREKRLERHVRCLRVWRLESERELVAVRGSSEVIEPNPSDAPLVTTFCFKNCVLASSETVGRLVGWSASFSLTVELCQKAKVPLRLYHIRQDYRLSLPKPSSFVEAAAEVSSQNGIEGQISAELNRCQRLGFLLRKCVLDCCAVKFVARVTASGQLCPRDRRATLASSARLFNSVRLLAKLTHQISTLEIAA